MKSSGGKQVEGPVHLIEAAMRHVSEAVVITTTELDPPGPEIVYVNEGFCRMSGYAAEEVIGKTPRILQGPKTDRAELDRLRRCLSRGEPFEGEVINYRKDGSEYLLRLRIVPLRDDAGEITHWMASQRDVIERRPAKKALKKSERRLRTIIENAPVVLFALDREGVFTLSEGKGLRALLGLEPGEAVGRSVFALYRGVPEILEHVRRALRGEEVYDTVEVGELAFEVFYGPLRDEGGKVVGVIGVAGDITSRKRAEERLRYLAFHDPLTGLPNRALLMDRLEHALARTDRREGKVAVLFIDLDNFKIVNDSLGHEAGDNLLVAVAGRLRARLRSEDTLAKFGGDELVILLEDVTDVGQATHVADRIMEGLREPFVVEGREVTVSASTGIVLAASSQERPSDLLRKADIAMYEVKQKGGAGYEVFDTGMNIRALQRLSWRADSGKP